MKPLEGYLVAYVAHDQAGASYVDALRRAGATVRVSSPAVDLWTILGEGAFDALVLLASDGPPTASAVLGALADDPRTREIPALVLADPRFAGDLVREAKARPAALLSTEASGDALVESVAALTAPQQRLSDLEVQHRALQDLVRSLNARADDSRIELSEVAHDLRALLGIAFGFACNLRDEIAGPLTKHQREHVMRILEAARDATGLVDRTRDSGRMPRALTMTPSLRPASVRPPSLGRVQRTLVDLGTVAASVKTLFEHAAHAQGKRLSCRMEPVSVWGDALKLKQVVTNLVVNAMKFSPPGGEIGIAVRWGAPAESSGPQARKRAEIVVTDTGPGIDPAFRERIFERGFRVERDAHLPGKGVGLSIVREVIAQHGGAVRVDGLPGEGAVFTVTLPYDMRVRSQPIGALFVPESSAAGELVDAVRAANPGELAAAGADRPREFLDLAAAAGALVVVPRDKTSAFSEALARILLPGAPGGGRSAT